MNKTKNAKNVSIPLKNTTKQNKNNEFYYNEDLDKEIVKNTLKDFEERAQERRQYELAWELNMNFMLGNQYSCILPSGEIKDSEKTYYWEEREVYNHIAPIIETRLAKLGKVRPTVSVKPTSSEQNDLYCAKLSKAILDSTIDKIDLSETITEATIWSEITGTSFYKVVWDDNIGDTIAKENGIDVKNGDVSITVCSPFEIYPDSAGNTDIENCESIIHARAYPTERIKELWGKDVEGKDIDTISIENGFTHGAMSGASNIPKLSHFVKHNHSMVIEKYTKPNNELPLGRLTIIAGEKLLYDGDLPYSLGKTKERTFPFIKQVSNVQVGSFWGTSVIERCIPIQRAYNAIKNRKHEYMARLASGVLAVEDGSVDIDNIEEEGLAPGKILVYRNGTTPPRFIDPGTVPHEFNSEEDRLLEEFVTVSGVSEFMRDSKVPSTVTSGAALSLLIEQDETRLSVTAEYIRNAVRKIAQYIIRLYKQFANVKRLSRSCDENGDIEIYYWQGSELSNDDVVLDTINELTETPAQRKNMLLELYRAGLLNDENGKLDNRNRARLLEALGFGIWDTGEDITKQHIKRAIKENINLTDILPMEIDDHDIHIAEHTKFILSDEANKYSAEHIKKLQNHILSHKSMKYATEQLQLAEATEYLNNMRN